MDELIEAYDALDDSAYYRDTATTLSLKIERSLEDLNQRLSQADSLLDVGCGSGEFLATVRQRYSNVRLVGQELPGQSAKMALKRGLEIETRDLAEIEERFDIITLLDVAEHLAEPHSTFRACIDRLNASGTLYLRTPRRTLWDSLAIRTVRLPLVGRVSRAWLGTRVSVYHLQLWTDAALRLLLEQAGFELLEQRRETELSWPLERYGQIYLRERRGLHPFIVSFLVRAVDLVFIKLGTFRNKAICLAKPAANPSPVN